MRSLPRPPRPCTAHLTAAFTCLRLWRKHGLTMLCGQRITQSDVARWCGVSQPYVCKLELGLVFPTAAMLPGILNGYAVRTEAEFRRMWEYPLDWNALPLWNFTRRLKPTEGIVLADGLPAVEREAVSA